MTLGSLFDGIGCWQLAALRAGINPLWSSEIDSFCCQITRRHFPNTIQLGDINSIHDATFVDIISASSPCQDLSLAGKRGGIHADRSGLFFKAVELVRRLKPKFFIWENVTGAFTSNGGFDFQSILQEILQESVPLPKYWSYAGLVDGRHCQIAWRTLDSQYWGVPQRRKRIFLVADFTNRRADKILFERQSETKSFADYSKTPCQSSNRIVFGIARDAFNKSKNAKFKPTILRDLQPTLTARGAGAVFHNNIIRRLTPLECERLMGLPDNWTQGGSDSKHYKAIGNSLVINCAEFILKRVKGVVNNDY